MAAIKRLFAQPWFMPLVFFIVFALLVLLLGHYFAFADWRPFATYPHKLFFISLVLLVWLLFAFYRYTKRQRQNEALSQELQEQSQLAQEKSAEAAALKEKFEQAVAVLKRNSSGNRSLAELPWYMIIGSPGSGKTTLLSNSGLEFPLAQQFGNQSVKGIGGTKNCDWWFTQDAVLLDTAGRYTSQESNTQVDSAAWQKFLSLISKYRKKPVNGILLSFSMEELLTGSNHAIAQLISQAKQRINELNECFNVVFPVYVMLTKSDKIPGFTTYFEMFGYREREQVFGITFDEKQGANSNGIDGFKASFSQLVRSITQRQWRRIELERDPSRKALVYQFSHQIAGLESLLSQIVSELSTSDHYYRASKVRGIYFTSGTQHGAAIDKLLSSVAQSIGLSARPSLGFTAEPRSYFIKDLLQQVVFPEANEFGVEARFERRKRIMLRVGYLSVLIASSLLLMGWLYSHNHSQNVIAKTEQELTYWQAQYAPENVNSDKYKRLPGALAPLNHIAKSLDELENVRASGIGYLGLGVAGSLRDSLTESYQRMLELILFPAVKATLESQLANRNADTELLFQGLKAYLMLNDTERRNPEFLSDWLSVAWSLQYRLSGAQSEQLAKHFSYYINDGLRTAELDQQLISATRRKLNQRPVAELYYYQFKQSYIHDTRLVLGMADLAGAQWEQFFTVRGAQNGAKKVQLNALYTAEFFNKVSTQELAKYIATTAQDNWVLGEQVQMPSPIVLRNEMLSHYARDFVDNWRGLLSQLNVRSFATLDDAINTLENASGENSSLLYFLQTLLVSTDVKDENLVKQLAAQGVKSQSTIGRILSARSRDNNEAVNSPTQSIDRAFRGIRRLRNADSQAAFEDRLLTRLSALYVHFNDLKAIGSASDYQELEQNMKPVIALKTFAARQPTPIKRWLQELAKNAESVLQKGTRADIAQIWLAEYLTTCQAITQSRFPFTPTASQDVLLSDFNRLFGAQGILQQYYEQHLQVLVNNASYPWRWRSNIPMGMRYGEQVLRFFERVAKIQESYFAQDKDNASVQLMFRPAELDARLSQVSLNVSGQKLAYQFGPQINELIVWPSQQVVEQIMLSFKRADGSDLIDRDEGPFAFFRLINKHQLRTIDANRVSVNFAIDGFEAVYDISSPYAPNPFVNAPLAGFRCLESFQ
ncbi:type VI secretion system membrane subunit TssM [Thalassotalea euphylliae]|uniref:Type VI secretion system membrane subunit TssM n=1 Tax=Thalassotalea euphylliae TaxID=1655234 RepID=A0A3E0TTD3_9GAMM|nr:type VI secretion system membrane subunit TssM [Thalassotalea euphylliae]REL27674.1 type VI secretion system membrane subunit TssM [Thalassotalea euphylliae]